MQAWSTNLTLTDCQYGQTTGCLSDWLDLKVEVDEGKYKALDVLYNVVEHTKALRILTLLNVKKRTYFSRLRKKRHGKNSQ